MVLDRLKRLTPAEKAKALARVTCQLFGNILAVLERAAPGKQPDYVVVLRYAVAMAGLQFHSRNIRASNAAEIVELTVPNAARSIAHTLDNEGLIADRNKFFQDFMAEPVREFAASIESLTLNMAMGEDAAARALSLQYAADALGEPEPIKDDEIKTFVDDFGARTRTASRIIMKIR